MKGRLREVKHILRVTQLISRRARPRWNSVDTGVRGKPIQLKVAGKVNRDGWALKVQSSVLNLFSDLLVASKFGQTSSSSLIDDVHALF